MAHVVWWWWDLQSHFLVQRNCSVEVKVVLRCRWGCDNIHFMKRLNCKLGSECEKDPDTFETLLDTFQKPSRQLTYTLLAISRQFPDTFLTTSRHFQDAKEHPTQYPYILKTHYRYLLSHNQKNKLGLKLCQAQV